MYLYKVSLSSLLVALVAIQQSYAIQSLSREQWEFVFCEAYQCSLLHDTGTSINGSTKETLPETCSEPGSRYAAVSLKSRKEFGFYSDIQATLHNIYTPANEGYAPFLPAIAGAEAKRVHRSTANAFPDDTDLREAIYNRNLQLRE